MDLFAALVHQAKENRRKYLDPFRERFESSSDRKGRAEVIIDLVKLEPSHFLETWIAEEVIKWMRDRDRQDDIERAFLLKRNRRGTEPDRIRYKVIRDFFLYEEIERIRISQNLSKKQAYTYLAHIQAESPNPLFPAFDGQDKDLELIIKANYNDHQKRVREGRFLPYPYWGLDLYHSENHGELVISARNVKVTMGGITYFGNWDYFVTSGEIKFQGHAPDTPELWEKYREFQKMALNNPANPP